MLPVAMVWSSFDNMQYILYCQYCGWHHVFT